MQKSERPQFASYDDFFAYYIQQHRDRRNRWLHASGTLVGLAALGAAIALKKPWWALLWLPLGYGTAWVGHFAVERNKPATFSHPWWSFISDFRMLGLMMTGGLDAWLERADRDNKPATADAKRMSR